MYRRWQTFRVCVLVGDSDPERAWIRARNRIEEERFTLIRIAGRDRLLKERVKKAGGEIWDAFRSVRRSEGVYFRADSDQPMAGTKNDPVTQLAPRITESFIDRIVLAAGGHRLEGVEANHGRTKNADYLIDDMVLELKILEEEGLEKESRQEKLGELLVAGRAFDGTSLPLSPELVAPESRRRFLDALGGPIKNAVKSASKQIRSTKTHLGRPDLRGGVIVVNSGYGSLDPETFEHLVQRFVKKDTSQISEVICISSWLVSNGFDSVVNFSYWPGEAASDAGKRIRAAYDAQVEECMTEFMRSGMRVEGKPLEPLGPIAFEHGGVQLFWQPPQIAPFSTFGGESRS